MAKKNGEKKAARAVKKTLRRAKKVVKNPTSKRAANRLNKSIKKATQKMSNNKGAKNKKSSVDVRTISGRGSYAAQPVNASPRNKPTSGRSKEVMEKLKKGGKKKSVKKYKNGGKTATRATSSTTQKAKKSGRKTTTKRASSKMMSGNKGRLQSKRM